MIGIPLGILIGLITGLVVLLLIRTAWRITVTNMRSVIALIAEFLAIPTFWLGGSWLSGSFLQSEDLTVILPNYIVSLACTFSAIALYPLLRIVISVGREVGQSEILSNDQ